MKIALIIASVIFLAFILFFLGSHFVCRRWRKLLDALPPDEQRKEQERMYRVEAWRS